MKGSDTVSETRLLDGRERSIPRYPHTKTSLFITDLQDHHSGKTALKLSQHTPISKFSDTGNSRSTALEQLFVKEISDQQSKLTVPICKKRLLWMGYMALYKVSPIYKNATNITTCSAEVKPTDWEETYLNWLSEDLRVVFLPSTRKGFSSTQF